MKKKIYITIRSSILKLAGNSSPNTFSSLYIYMFVDAEGNVATEFCSFFRPSLTSQYDLTWSFSATYTRNTNAPCNYNQVVMMLGKTK